MTRFRFSAALLLALAIPLVTTPTARADLPDDSKAMLQQRLDQLGTHFHGGSLARWSVPDDRAALEKVWDVPTILGHSPYAARDVSTLVQIIKVEAELLRKYTNAGEAAPGSPKEARVRTKYQDEIVRGSAFLTSASAATLQAIGDFASRLKPEDLKPERRAGLEHGRRGVRAILENLDAELRLPEVSAENKMVLLDALAANASVIAAYSPPADRKSYVATAEATLPSLSEAGKAKLQTFIAAMDTKDCRGLCTIKD